MNKNREKIYSIAAIIIIVDQIIKILVSSKIKLDQLITVIPNFFSITYTKNKGAAFSILQNQKILLVVISLVVLYFLNKYIDKYKDFNKISIISLGFIIGGIVGNLIDRLIYDGVIDYLSFRFGNYYFPIFNLADSFIVIGVILLLINLIFEDKINKKDIPVRDRLSEGVEIIKNDKEETTKTKKKSTNSSKKKTKNKKNTKKKS